MLYKLYLLGLISWAMSGRTDEKRAPVHMLLLLLYPLLPVVEAGVWDCATNPVAQVVVEAGGTNSYSTILSWDFVARTFTTAVCELGRTRTALRPLCGASRPAHHALTQLLIYCIPVAAVHAHSHISRHAHRYVRSTRLCSQSHRQRRQRSESERVLVRQLVPACFLLQDGVGGYV